MVRVIAKHLLFNIHFFSCFAGTRTRGTNYIGSSPSLAVSFKHRTQNFKLQTIFSPPQTSANTCLPYLALLCSKSRYQMLNSLWNNYCYRTCLHTLTGLLIALLHHILVPLHPLDLVAMAGKNVTLLIPDWEIR